MPTNIPAQDLGSALKTFAETRDLQVLYFSGIVRDVRTSGASGDLTADEALTTLLKGTGLTYQYVHDKAITLLPIAGGAESTSRAEGTSPGPTGVEATGDTDSDTGQSSSAVTLEEVVVTAQKRVERLQDTPISITAITSQDIERRGLVDQMDYMRSIPGVTLLDNGPGLNNLVMRGAYGGFAFNTGPTVGVYMGDVPLTGYAIGGSADVILEDIERVEVLRGPQGTLYGSNALSGAVRYIPRQPDLRDFDAHVEAGYSQTARYGGGNTQLNGVVNIPLIAEKLAVRAVAYRHENEGVYRNRAGSDPVLQAGATRFGAQSLAINDDHEGANAYTGGRVSAFWKPVDRLDVTLTWLKQQTSQENSPVEDTPFGLYQRSQYQLGNPVAGEDPLEIDVDIVNLVGELELQWGALLSSTSWIDQDFTRNTEVGPFFTPFTGGVVAPITQPSFTAAQVLAQEVRFTSAFQGPLQMVAGLYYEDSEQPTGQPTYFAGDPALNPFAAVQMWDLTLDRQVKQKAAFGELSYQIAPMLEATLGGRVFEYDATFNRAIFNSRVPGINNVEWQDTLNESHTTTRAGLELKPSDDVLVYLSRSEGFRLGRPQDPTTVRSLCDRDANGLLDGTAIPLAGLDRITSDTLASYELGSKLSVLNGRAFLHAAAYHNDWDDIPIVIPASAACPSNISTNGGKARARGIELESTLRLTRGLQLGAGVGYVDAELTRTTPAGNAGDRMNFMPKINGNLNAEYGFAIMGYEAFVRGDYTYFGNYFTGTGGRGIEVPGYSLVSLSAGIGWERLSAQLLVTNLLNADDVASREGLLPTQVVRLRPRTIGLTLGYRF